MLEIQTTEKKVMDTKVVRVECDFCHKSFFPEKDERMEIQEFHHIRFTGGYSSVFGDMNVVECDICQHCLKNILGDRARITHNSF